MRLLADENFPRLVVQKLRSCGYNVVWISEERPGILDSEVLSFATAEQRLLITFDKEDFGELIFKGGRKAPYGIVMFRIPKNDQDLPQTVAKVLKRQENWAGNFFSVHDLNDIRCKPMSNL